MRTMTAQFQAAQPDATAIDISLWTSQIDDIHKMFIKEHSYLESTWPSSHLDHEYFSLGIHQQELEAYCDAKTVLSRIMQSIADNQIRPEHHRTEIKQFQLADILLPKFAGEYREWPAFRDLFTSLVLRNLRYTNIERLHYLKGCLIGSPAQKIINFPMVGDSLRPAWELLKQRYENRRLIIHDHLDTIMAISPLTTCNAESLRRLISTVSEAVTGLSTLGITDQLSDCMLVHHVSRHLDQTTCDGWETSLGDAQEYPSFTQLESFINTRSRALESIEATSS